MRYETLKTNFGCAENIGGATFSAMDGSVIVEHVDLKKLQEERIAHVVPHATDNDQTMSIVSSGRPHPQMSIKILSESGQPLPDGYVGEVALNTPSHMEGYLDEARETQYAILSDLLCTGDLGYMRNGELFWTGRARERINVQGKKLDPSDFEPVLLHIAGLREGSFVAFGVDDKKLGTQRIVIGVEVRESTSRTPQELSREIRNKISRQLGVGVSEVMLLQRGILTKTSSGKRRHRHFHTLYLQGKLKSFEWQPEAEQSVEGPRNEIEEQLLNIWENLFDHRPISIKDNFFDLGGASVLAAQLFAEITKTLGKDLPLATLFEAATIEELASILHKHNGTSNETTLVAVQPHGSKVPFFCAVPPRGTVVGMAELAHYLGPDQPFYGLHVDELKTQALNGERAILTMKEIAAHYIHHMHSVQPEGPYLLGGRCGGATVAYEMAQQLLAQGEKVHLLAILTSSPRDFRRPRTHYARRMVYHWRNGRLLRTILLYVPFKIKKWRYKLKYFIRRLRALSKGQQDNRKRGHSGWADHNYTFESYAGRVTVFETSDAVRVAWSELAQSGVDYHIIEGTHHQILREPTVQVLAKHLSACLDAVQADNGV